MGHIFDIIKRYVGSEKYPDAKHHVEVAVEKISAYGLSFYLDEYCEELEQKSGSNSAAAQSVVECVLHELGQPHSNIRASREGWLNALDGFCQKHNLPKIYRSEPKPKEERPPSITISGSASETQKASAINYGDPKNDNLYWI
ncbi:hypothetical protein KJ885_03855 [Patescibacteria group bacterium]|nr:hypothetical protein [Patescibacteria group bacterium]